MKLSVVIPCLDAAATLGEQLLSLAGQRCSHPWELLVADNGSTDGSRELAASFADRIASLRLVDAGDRRGQAHARNVAAAAAAGEALVFVDADDVVAPGFLQEMGDVLERGAAAAVPRMEYELLNPEWVGRVRTPTQVDGLTPYDYPPYLPHVGGSGLSVSSAVHRELGGFDEAMPALEDTDYSWRLQLAGHTIAFVADAVLHVRFSRELSGLFRQARRYGRYNVFIYRRFRDRGMPRLQWWRGPASWVKLGLRVPRLATRSGRAAWLWQLGWRLGRLDGCVRYRTFAP